ncbi:UvrB/UvrC motif-containing protein [Gammaproteobacteria bacterium]|nr:UvrB/UvrC motif-containing protein [Gammaproteobacteria bacterium]
MGNIFKVFFSFSAMILLSSCDIFLVEKKQIEQCNNHLEMVYENTPLNNFEQTKFKDLLENRFPKYEEMFYKASIETSIDSELLAAISFQESQWDPRAKSNMGVRGMMMVTLETAAIVGVEKRLNPDKMTGSMERAIAETDRRRAIQEKYNIENNITPKSITTKVKDIMEGARVISGKAKKQKEDIEKSLPFKIKDDSIDGLSESIEKIENQMYKYAKEMEFEKAAQCRDKMKFLKRKLIDL